MISPLKNQAEIIAPNVKNGVIYRKKGATCAKYGRKMGVT
jgi:hypothetical protein